MKRNLFAGILVVPVLLLVVLGCSKLGSLTKGKTTGNTSATSNKTVPIDTSNSTGTDENTGIPECDKVLDALAQESNNPDDGYIAKATKAAILNGIKAKVRETIEQDKDDKVELAKRCTDYYAQLQKYKAEQNANKGE